MNLATCFSDGMALGVTIGVVLGVSWCVFVEWFLDRLAGKRRGQNEKEIPNG